MPNIKLNERKVLKIREMYKQGNYTYSYLAAMFKVSPDTICNIVTGRSWRHVQPGKTIEMQHKTLSFITLHFEEGTTRTMKPNQFIRFLQKEGDKYK